MGESVRMTEALVPPAAEPVVVGDGEADIVNDHRELIIMTSWS